MESAGSTRARDFLNLLPLVAGRPQTLETFPKGEYTGIMEKNMKSTTLQWAM